MRRGVGWAAPGWRDRQWPVDALLTAVLAAVVVASVASRNPAVAYEFRAPSGWSVGLGLVASLPLAVRRRWPFTVAALVTAAVVAIAVGRWDPGQTPFCLFVALYTVAAWCRRAVAVAGLAFAYAGLGLAALLGVPYFDHPFGWLIVVAATTAWVMGRVMRRWRGARDNAVARALVAQRARTLAAERAVFAERLRLARELHDVVSHTLSLIAVQSGVARHRFGHQADPAGSALAAIEQASRAALNDLRRMLGVLRDDTATGSTGAATDPAPPPGVAELEPLAAAHRAAYGPVELSVDPAAGSAPPSLRLTVYRLVQEALTNARKHAPGAAAWVSVRAEAGTFVVQIDNDGPGRGNTLGPVKKPDPDQPDRHGYGLLGMRERVSLFGGSIAAGPRQGGGFQVRAVLRESAHGSPAAEPGGEPDDQPDPVVPHPQASEFTRRGLVPESLVDAVVAVTLAAFGIADAYVRDPAVAHPYPRPNALLVVLVLAAGLPLAVRRRWPVAVFLGAAGIAFLVALRGWNAEVPGFCSFVALYTVAAWRRLPVATASLALLVTADATLAMLHAPNFDYAGELWGAGAAVPWGVGLIVRRWRHEREQALARALEAERTRVVAAERAVFAERLRIAREMHDIVSHTLSVIAVQSGVARHQLAGQSSPIAPALTVIEEASRAALDDLRRMLGALRADTDPEDSLGPSPAVAELDLLISAHRAVCGPVELAVDAATGSAPPSVQMTVYRLVQEALTNIRKHAAGAATRVTVRAATGTVTVTVDNDPPRGAGPTDDDGYLASNEHALTGMRERVAIFNGSLHAEPGEDGGFRVRAVLRDIGEVPAT